MAAAALAAATPLALACGTPDNAELAGDHAYGTRHFAEALRDYRAASTHASGGRLWAKLAAAALHARDLRAASDAYRRLAAEDPTRAQEAAEGLDAVARAAGQRRDVPALRDAVLGLRAIAPERSIARYALVLVRSAGASAPGTEALSLLPAALAAAPDAAIFDSLLTTYAAALQESAGCDQAAPAFRAALRRAREPAVRARAGSGLAGCALRLGLTALGAGQMGVAADWLSQAARVDSTSWVGRRALVALGDARVGQGDILGAAIAFQTVLDLRLPTDSLTRLAATRLRALGAPQPLLAPSAPIDTARRRMP